MDRIAPPKPVAYMRWADEEKKAEGGGLSYGIESQGIIVWVRCREDSFMFSWIRARLHPGGTPKHAQLLLVCPRCTTQLRIPGAYKTFQWEQLAQPRQVSVPGNPDAVNVVRITISEDCGCPQCKQMFRLTENVLSKA